MKIDQAFILAAGLGKRLRPLTLTTPKPLLPLNGKPLIHYTLERLRHHGVKKIVINTHYLAEQIHAYLATLSDLPILISHEPDLLETAGGVLNVLSEFSSNPFFVINADVWWQESHNTPLLQQLEKQWREDDMDILMALIPKSRAISFLGVGDYHIKEDSRLQFRQSHQEAPYIFSGIRIVHPRLFAGLAPGFSSQLSLFHQAEANGRLYGMIHDYPWCDIGTPAAYQALQAFRENPR